MRPPRTWKSRSGWIPLISSTMWHWRMHTQDPAEMTTRAASGKSLSSWPGRAIRGARVSRRHGRLLGGEGSALARSAKAERTGAGPGNRVAFLIADGHDGVV